MVIAGDDPTGEHTVLVLSAGGMRGLAHVGVWRALVETGIRIDRVVGSSIGALVGAAFASGMTAAALEQRALRVGRKDVAVPRRWPWWARGADDPGLLRGDVLRSFVEGLLPQRPLQRLEVPLEVAVVDLDSGELRWFSFGPDAAASSSSVGLVDAVLASMSIPVFYPPVEVGGARCVDGGMLAPIPVSRAVETGADRILAVDVSTDVEPEAPGSTAAGRGLLGVSMRALTIATASRNGGPPEAPGSATLHCIRPELDGTGAFTFDRNEELIEQGYRAARPVLDRIGPDAALRSGPDALAS